MSTNISKAGPSKAGGSAPDFPRSTRVGRRRYWLGKFNEGGALVHARGRVWGRLIFKDLFKKEQ